MNRIDLRGVACPVNAVRVKQAVVALGDDELVEVILDAGESLIQAVRSINDAGFRIISSEQLDNAVAIIVGKARKIEGVG
ncbi:MAG: sulfurtransferase TusA family protein [Chlorobiaceae bacterium]|nr:sulfurtransferase TusA family protein [Chlorobiaceae bacterium]